MYKFFVKTLFLGKKIYFLPNCHSTNSEATRLVVENDENDGTIIITDYQYSGKGQKGNTWESESGRNIILSIILKPYFINPIAQFSLHTVCSLAVYDTLFPYLGKKLKIKWPNDIYYENRKLCGILIENSIRGNKIDTSIIGIGLNVNQINFNIENATSLKKITLQDFDKWNLMENLLFHIEQRYLQLKNNQYHKLKTLYLSRLYRINEQHLFSASGKTFLGKIKGVNVQGKLLIVDDFGEKAYNYKEIAFVI